MEVYWLLFTSILHHKLNFINPFIIFSFILHHKFNFINPIFQKIVKICDILVEASTEHFPASMYIRGWENVL
jgi:hypothetical protein